MYESWKEGEVNKDKEEEEENEESYIEMMMMTTDNVTTTRIRLIFFLSLKLPARIFFAIFLSLSNSALSGKLRYKLLE